MSEIIERVARAIFRVEWSGVLFQEAAGNAEGVKHEKERMLWKARAAIEAMRDPTEGMVLAMIGKAPSQSMRDADPFDGCAIFQAAVDEALK